MITDHEAAVWCLRLAMVALVITAIEPLAAWHFFDRRGPLWSKLSRLQELTSLRAARPAHELVGRDGVFAGLCAAQLVLAAAVFARPDTRLGWILLVVANLVFLRLRVGLDASDGLVRMILAANAVRLINPATLTTAFILFMGCEACLAYFTSGFSKLGSTVWIEGRALAKTLSTITYGDPSVSRLLWRHRAVGRLASWATIAVEVLFPLALVLPLPFAGALLVAAGLFHVCCARIMALGAFVWAFVATYPCVLALRAHLPLDRAVRAGILLFFAIAVVGQLGSTVAAYRHRSDSATPAVRS
jgi:hypothetical protein